MHRHHSTAHRRAQANTESDCRQSTPLAPTLSSSPALAALHALSATKPLDRTALPKPSSPQTLPSSSTSQGQHRQSVPRLCTSPAATLGGLRTPLVLCAAFGVPEPICVVAWLVVCAGRIRTIGRKHLANLAVSACTADRDPRHSSQGDHTRPA
ncbi:hypothetical protein AcV5_003867 [Taiwanofungus camphoratus]|nr:hypothetical protein AcV5_003867 [Antrodia cinnamomea]